MHFVQIPACWLVLLIHGTVLRAVVLKEPFSNVTGSGSWLVFQKCCLKWGNHKIGYRHILNVSFYLKTYKHTLICQFVAVGFSLRDLLQFCNVFLI